jgi:hypothetical protein
VVCLVHDRERAQFLLSEPRLRAVEARPPGVLSKPLEKGLDRRGITVPERPDEELWTVLSLQYACVHTY